MHSESDSTAEDTGTRNSVKRQRITRACDRCNRKRVKCDGNHPCARCKVPGQCEYTRRAKKRGKVPQEKPRGLSASNAMPPPSTMNHELISPVSGAHHDMPGSSSLSNTWGKPLGTSNGGANPQPTTQKRRMSSVDEAYDSKRLSAFENGVNFRAKSPEDHTLPNDGQNRTKGSGVDQFVGNAANSHASQPPPPLSNAHMGFSGASAMQGQPAPSTRFEPIVQPNHFSPPAQRVRAESQADPNSANGARAHPTFGPSGIEASEFIPHGDNSMSLAGVPMQVSPPSLDAPPIAQNSYDSNWMSTNANSTYPVLKPLLPYIRSFLTGPQAASLLELYFSSAFSIHMHPVCRHVHAYVFRKSSILRPVNPRPCSPALLASMLCAAAETGGADMLSWSHTRRRKVSRKLYVVSIQLLRPLVHFDIGCVHAAGEGPADGYVDAHRDAPPLPETAGSLDDVVTYIHIASITSASEHKAASMRWWHAAFTLSRELKFNKEIPGGSSAHEPSCPRQAGYNQGRMDGETDVWTGLESYNFEQGLFDFMENTSTTSDCNCAAKHDSEIDEEGREERRRVWWLLYIMDRHLALCYNRSLSILDAECEELLLPMDEISWQLGGAPEDGRKEPVPKRRHFPSFECTDHNIYGFFLPLMTIVGEIIDLNHARNHPLLDLARRGGEGTGALENEILRQLDMYQNSLQVFEVTHSGMNALSSPSQETLHTKTVVAYATHVTHVCHILLAGKWDPVSLFDDEDLWISSPSFASTMRHAALAADAVGQMLELDPDMSFMPYFLGIQLLQGSFVLLLVIDRLQTKTDPSIIHACEVVIRATEACVATLDTEYQRNYRQILRSAVFQAKGRYVAQKEAQFRRKAVLALYRWTRSGTGLAL